MVKSKRFAKALRKRYHVEKPATTRCRDCGKLLNDIGNHVTSKFCDIAGSSVTTRRSASKWEFYSSK